MSGRETETREVEKDPISGAETTTVERRDESGNVTDQGQEVTTTDPITGGSSTSTEFESGRSVERQES